MCYGYMDVMNVSLSTFEHNLGVTYVSSLMAPASIRAGTLLRGETKIGNEIKSKRFVFIVRVFVSKKM